MPKRKMSRISNGSVKDSPDATDGRPTQLDEKLEINSNHISPSDDVVDKDSPIHKQPRVNDEAGGLDETDTPPTPANQNEEGVDGRFKFGSNNSKKKDASPYPQPSSPTLLPDLHDESCYYSMKTQPRGYCVIINNRDFEYSSGMQKYPRKGTDVDANMAEELFTELGFIVRRENNQTVYQMRRLLKEAAMKDYSKLSAFVCIILSHGQEGILYGIDATLEIRELTSMFRGTNLAGKPKLFLFQACQGSEYMDSVLPDAGHMETDGPSDSYGNDISLPTESDFLYAYSTVPGYYSWRNSVTGSWFMQAIVETFRNYAHKMDVVRMLTRVNNIVSTQKSRTGQYMSHNKRQISSIITQLRKELYLFPLHGPLKPVAKSIFQ